jgi:hypothetical protein
VDRETIIKALLCAYNMGAYAAHKVNFGRNGFTSNMERLERGTLNALLKDLGQPTKLTDEEYKPFQD